MGRRRVDDEYVPECQREIGDRAESETGLARQPGKPAENGRFGRPGDRERCAREEIGAGDSRGRQSERDRECGEISVQAAQEEHRSDRAVARGYPKQGQATRRCHIRVGMELARDRDRGYADAREQERYRQGLEGLPLVDELANDAERDVGEPENSRHRECTARTYVMAQHEQRDLRRTGDRSGDQ